MSYTKNANQIENSIIPAYERELAGARARKDKETAVQIEEQISWAKKLAGIPVKETTEKKAPEKRVPNTDLENIDPEKTDTKKTDE